MNCFSGQSATSTYIFSCTIFSNIRIQLDQNYLACLAKYFTMYTLTDLGHLTMRGGEFYFTRTMNKPQRPLIIHNLPVTSRHKRTAAHDVLSNNHRWTEILSCNLITAKCQASVVKCHGYSLQVTKLSGLLIFPSLSFFLSSFSVSIVFFWLMSAKTNAVPWIN